METREKNTTKIQAPQSLLRSTLRRQDEVPMVRQGSASRSFNRLPNLAKAAEFSSIFGFSPDWKKSRIEIPEKRWGSARKVNNINAEIPDISGD
jgi:hypothetical protein